MTKKQKFYVVWDGFERGVYDTWEACEEAVKGYQGALYQSFKTEAEAKEAFEMGYKATREKIAAAGLTREKEVPAEKVAMTTPNPEIPLVLPAAAINESIAVDAACSGNPGPMEYRGVDLRTGQQIFHFGPVSGTNNIGEFLAIVHALALLKKSNSNMTIYSDSISGMAWVRNRKAKTTLPMTPENARLYDIIHRAENWLRTNSYSNKIIKWNTDKWGEIPADFGRK